MSTPTIDRNLLIGILALQMDLITRDQLVMATNVWLGDKSRSLADILVAQQVLQESDRAVLEPMAFQHIESTAVNPTPNLVALASVDTTVDGFEPIDGDLASTVSVSKGASHETSLEPTISYAVASSSPTAIGETESLRFRVLRPHARGGLGEVFLAKDIELNREVALKKIQLRFADNESSRLRFLIEAEITGGLEHPGIVPVYGLGRYADGRPYYAMRFIKGDSLEEAVDQFFGKSIDALHGSKRREARENPVSVEFTGVEYRNLLGRFINVCQAIEYAHSRGVLHRDLKPGNIMLGKYGETLVVDWGLAKTRPHVEAVNTGDEDLLQPASSSSSEPTMMGVAIGTPSYMPPEQAAGRIDQLAPASDVYSLGATLYYMLTGTSPCKGKNVNEVLQNARSGKFKKPHVVQPQLPKALEAICLKAMSLASADRYVSPQQIADEVERYLADEPVQALTEPAYIRARRWIRKHPRVVGSIAATLLVGLSSAIMITTIVMGKNLELATANGELKKANQAEHRALELKMKESERANQNLARATLVVKRFTTEVVSSRELLNDTPGTQMVRSRLLVMARDFYQDFLASNTEVTSLSPLVAHSELQLSVAAAEIGDSELAESSAASAYARFTTLVNQTPSRDLQDGLAATSQQLGYLHERRGQLEDAEQFYAASVAARRGLNDNSPQEILGLLRSLVNLGNTEEQLGRNSEAKVSFQEAVDVSEPWLAHELNDAQWEEFLLTWVSALDGLARLEILSKDFELARTRLTQALALLNSPRKIQEKSNSLSVQDEFAIGNKSAIERSLMSPRLARFQLSIGNNLVAIALMTGKFESVQTELEPLIQIAEAIAAANPSAPEYVLQYAELRSKLGLAQHMTRPSDSKGIESFQSAIKSVEVLLQRDPLNHKAHVALSAMELNFAVALLQGEMMGSGLFGFLIGNANREDSEPHADRAYELSLKLVKETPTEVGLHASLFASAILRAKIAERKFGEEKALELCQAMLENLEPLLPPGEVSAEAQLHLAELERHAGSYLARCNRGQEGVPYLRAARKRVKVVSESSTLPNESVKTWLLAGMGESQLVMDQHPEISIQICEEASPFVEQLNNESERLSFRHTVDVRFIESANRLAWSLATSPDPNLNDPVQAIQLAKRALERKPSLSSVTDTLAVAHAANGDFDEAIKYMKQAIDLAPKDVDESNLDQILADFQSRLELFQQQTPYVEAMVQKTEDETSGKTPHTAPAVEPQPTDQ